MQGKQAKIVSPTQERAILGYLVTTRYPARDRVMFLLSLKAGLRAKEMASLTWAMVTDAAGQAAEVLHVPNRASKGKTGGRTHVAHLLNRLPRVSPLQRVLGESVKVVADSVLLRPEDAAPEHTPVGHFRQLR